MVGNGKTPVPHLASSPGLKLAPKDFTPEMLRPLAKNDYEWHPERSASGPITMVVSAAARSSAGHLKTGYNTYGKTLRAMLNVCIRLRQFVVCNV